MENLLNMPFIKNLIDIGVNQLDLNSLVIDTVKLTTKEKNQKILFLKILEYYLKYVYCFYNIPNYSKTLKIQTSFFKKSIFYFTKENSNISFLNRLCELFLYKLQDIKHVKLLTNCITQILNNCVKTNTEEIVLIFPTLKLLPFDTEKDLMKISYILNQHMDITDINFLINGLLLNAHKVYIKKEEELVKHFKKYTYLMNTPISSIKSEN